MTRFVVLFIAAMLVAAVPATSVAGEADEYEEVVFRVTLEGPVNPTHTLAVQRECPEEICVTEAIVLVCSPPHDSHGLPACSATTYEFTSEIRAGLTVDYALLRWTTPDLRHTSDQPEEHLHGSWVVHDGRQFIALGYAYPGGTPSEPTAGPVLPDTALPSPSDE